jgi:hypothetical protein
MDTRIVKGRELLLSVDGVSIGCANSVEFNSSFEMVQAACRENGAFYDAEPGTFTATLSVEGLMKIDTPQDATQNRYYDLAGLHMNQTKIAWVFGTDVVGEEEWSGNAYITSYSQSAPQEDNGTYSLELAVVGTYQIGPKPV